jgi:hypothetical protein
MRNDDIDSGAQGGGRRPMLTLTASFKNDDSVSSKHWTVTDAHSNAIVIDQDFQPDEEVSASLQASPAGKGEVFYKTPNQSNPSHKDLIDDGDVVDMF